MSSELAVDIVNRDERELLARCGLNPTEQTIILHLLENRRAGAGAIAKRTGIKRPTVYSALSSLENQGLVTRQRIRGVVFFSAISPRTIPIILKNRAREQFKAIDEATRVLELKLPLVSKDTAHTFAGYEISILDSLDAAFALLENAITSGNYRGMFNPQTAIVGQGVELTQRFLEKDAEMQPFIKEIVFAGPQCDWYTARIKNPNHKVKVIEGDPESSMDFILLHDAAVVIDYSQPTASAILIKHAGYCRFMEHYFETLWNALPTK